jgi:hypothetical protein
MKSGYKRQNHRILINLAIVVCFCCTSFFVCHAKAASQPTSFTYAVQPITFVEQVVAEPIDLQTIQLEDQLRDQQKLPYRFGVSKPVLITPETNGMWEQINDETWLWRLQIASPNARSICLDFTRYFMPPGGSLFIYAADHNEVIGPFSNDDNKEHGRLATPRIHSDNIVVELTIPGSVVDELELELGFINHGYRGFGASIEKGAGDSGWCNSDVACPEGIPWSDQIRSVGYCSYVSGIYLFVGSGALINNTAQDCTPYFLTAHHLEITASNAWTVRIDWNYETSSCGGTCYSSSQTQTGTTVRASYSVSDFTLLELDDPPSASFDVYYAGWDRSSTAPSSAVAIHHPSGDCKKISIENNSTCISGGEYGEDDCGEGTNHIRVNDWDTGTTEGGSSGCPLFNSSKRIVGQLHGGSAACGNNLPDWFGRFYTSWTGGGTNSTRLSNWLDPTLTGQTTLNGKNPCVTDCFCESCEPEDQNIGTIGTVVWGYSATGNCGNCGKWVGEFTGEAGATYHFDLCPDSPGSGTNSGFDPDIKITNSSCSILDGEDGSCSSPSYSPNDYQWLCPSSGTYYVIIAPYSSYGSHNCTGDSGDTFTLRYYKEICSPPTPPTGVSSSDGTYCDRVRVSWVDNGATSYEIWRYTSDDSGSASWIDDDTASPYDDTSAEAGTIYWYWVKAKNSCGTSGFSNGDSGYCVITPPDAPVLHIEPNITPGLCNLISWDTVPEAKAYYAECSSDPCFLVVDYNSGWITRTSYQFCDLTYCQEYWYSVKSGLSAWSQTSQANFETDTLTDTIATSDGNVVLAGGAGTPIVDTVGGTTSPFTTSNGYFNGFLVTTGTTLTQIEVYLGISISRSIEFVVYEGGALFSDQYNRIHSSTLASSGTGTKFYTSDPISVPLEAGKHYMIGTVWSGSVTTYCDSSDSSPTFADHTGWGSCSVFPSPNILSDVTSSIYTFYHRYTTAQSTGGYDSPGSIVSTTIDLPVGGSWDVVDFNTTTPADTELTVDILPAAGSTPITGYENVSSGTDLGAIGDTTIRLRANLSTNDPNSTPALHDWSVTYADPAGIESDWSNIESSIQVIPGDFEPDCDVDWDDLAVLVDQWLQPPGTPSADIAPLPEGDGIVDFLDFAILANHWLEDTTP